MHNGKNYFRYLLFLSFFPQLSAGPIARGSQLLPQLYGTQAFRSTQATAGLRYILMGSAKKLLIADALSPFVDRIYADVTQYQGFTLLALVLFYSLQIYFDFSGYSEIAIGVAKLFGIDLVENFKSPYLCSDIREFWKRWHISLSSWLRDYVYIPLGGSHCSAPRRKLNLLITFLLSGLWHGSGSTFLLWGTIHGFYQILAGSFSHKKQSKANVLSGTVLSFVLVSLAWVPFRAEKLSDCLWVWGHLFSGFTHPVQSFLQIFNDMDLGILRAAKLAFYIFLCTLWDYAMQTKNRFVYPPGSKPLRLLVYAALSLLVFSAAVNGDAAQSFIYFKF